MGRNEIFLLPVFLANLQTLITLSFGEMLRIITFLYITFPQNHPTKQLFRSSHSLASNREGNASYALIPRQMKLWFASAPSLPQRDLGHRRSVVH